VDAFVKQLIADIDAPWAAALLLFIPYLLWGVYLLRQHFREGVEMHPAAEIGTLAGVVAFLYVEYLLLEAWLANTPVRYILFVLALLVSALALYGHLATSLTSQALARLVMPRGAHDLREPHYGAAEAHERLGDLPAAAAEYIAVAKMFPKDLRSRLRAADLLDKLGEKEQAAAWFEEALPLLERSDRLLTVSLRLAEIYERLEQPSKASQVLRGYLRRFPDSDRSDMLHKRVARLEGKG
jgi:tetratricopeptide (TPR) repeat protein